jgi:hypothetical protein
MTRPDQEGGSGRRLFLSYAREDVAAVTVLRNGLLRLQHNVWIDDRLALGQAWWDEILRQIRLCDAMVVAVSPSLLESQAGSREREYAIQLGKPILPVCLRAVSTQLLPPDLAELQFVDYCTPGPDAAFQFAYALGNLPSSGPLPVPLPAPPPVPVSYLSGLAVKVGAPSLTLDEQFALVAKLRAALGKPAERDAAGQLLRSLRDRQDLYHAPACELQELLAEPALESTRDPGEPARGPDPDRPQAHRIPLQTVAGTGEQHDHQARGTVTVATPEAAAPPGWYPDPTHRHSLRWFDGDWTDWACDGRAVVVDRL